jgi:predicted N-acetyltransferase YhbS
MGELTASRDSGVARPRSLAALVERLTDPRPLAIEDNREAFDCGRLSLNAWLQRHAWRNHKEGISRVSVVCDEGTGQIAGYVTLSATEIERGWLPRSDQRNRPEAIPAALIGQLAVDVGYQGRGVARYLMQFALRTSISFSKEIGCFGVVVHPLDDDLRTFYGRFGFRDMPFYPSAGMIVRIRDLEQNGF